MLYYLLGIVVSYIMSYIITTLFIKDEEVRDALGGIEEEAVEDIGQSEVQTESDSSAPANVKRATLRHGEKISFDQDKDFVFEYVISDPIGIHARPAGEISRILDKYGCDAQFNNGENKASGKSLIQMMTLGAVAGSKLRIVVSGRNAKKAGETLQDYMKEKL